MDKKELLELKTTIDSAKTRIAESKGKLQLLMAQLKEQYGCATVKEAEEKIKQLDTKIEDMVAQINKATKELQEKYDLINT